MRLNTSKSSPVSIGCHEDLLLHEGKGPQGRAPVCRVQGVAAAHQAAHLENRAGTSAEMQADFTDREMCELGCCRGQLPLQRYDKSMVRVRMGVSNDVPSENAQRLLQIVRSWAKAPRTKEKKFKVIDPKEIAEMQELAEELVEGLHNLEEELQGVPQRYIDADVIVVEDENGQEIDLLNFDGDGE